jgi:hypothetical protein
MIRRMLHISGGFVACVAITAAPIFAQTQPTTRTEGSAHTPQSAIDAGLAFLAGQQNADGSFQPAGTKLQTSALALLAYLSGGDIPDSGRYGDTVRRGAEFLLRQTPGDRYFGRVDGSRMRGQAIVTLALCEVYGVESDEQTRVRLHATVKDAVAFIIAAQSSKDGASGGWAADPGGSAVDSGVSLLCMIALRAARQIGLNVPQRNLDRGVEYLRQSTLSQNDSSPTSAPATPFPESVLYNLCRNGSDPDFFNSSSWKSASHDLLAAQITNGAWPAAETQSGPASTAETALHIFILSAQNQLLPVWMK